MPEPPVSLASLFEAERERDELLAQANRAATIYEREIEMLHAENKRLKDENAGHTAHNTALVRKIHQLERELRQARDAPKEQPQPVAERDAESAVSEQHQDGDADNQQPVFGSGLSRG